MVVALCSVADILERSNHL